LDLDVFSREPLAVRNGIPVFSHPDPYTENYERIAADHLETLHHAGANPFIPEELWVEFENATRDLLRRHARPGQTILDVGVGLGRLLSPLSELRRYGMDISWGYLERSRATGIDVCYARIEDMPYREGIFDLVVCTDVIEHVMDLNLCCQKILAVLQPGGILVVRVPYREDLSGYLAPSYPYRFVHMRSFDEHSLRLLFERVLGCEVLDMQTTGHIINESRLKFPLPWWVRVQLLAPALRAIQRISSAASLALVRQLYYPFEINVVIRRPSGLCGERPGAPPAGQTVGGR
jgi:2-polyprenyl-3-methyl-5-hydroxy-6-metoxy-1,4-benzoquinol methylase